MISSTSVCSKKFDLEQFYAQKQILKSKTNELEMSLEKNIMTSEMCKFIVRLHATLADKKFYYFLMGQFILAYSRPLYKQD